MMQKAFCRFLLVSLAFGLSPLFAKPSRGERISSEEFNQRDPIAEATANFRKGEIYVYSAMGVGQYYPGLDDHRTGERIEKKYGVRHLRGTSDIAANDAHLAYTRASAKFASAYNRQTVKLLAEKRRE